MKKQFKKKLALRKETIASLNESQQMLVLGGGHNVSDVTECQTNCAGCNTGASGNTCGDHTCPDYNTCNTCPGGGTGGGGTTGPRPPR